jgi:hypothetical protein
LQAQLIAAITRVIIATDDPRIATGGGRWAEVPLFARRVAQVAAR